MKLINERNIPSIDYEDHGFIPCVKCNAPVKPDGESRLCHTCRRKPRVKWSDDYRKAMKEQR